MNDMVDAVEIARIALRTTPYPHRSYASKLDDLSCALAERFDQLGSQSDLDQAVVIAREAVNITTREDPDRSPWLNNLGNRLHSWYKVTGDITHLNEAIDVVKEAAQIDGDYIIFNTMGSMLLSRYQYGRELSDLEDAISLSRKAVELSPNGPNHVAILNNLGSRLRERHCRLGKLEDIDEAVSIAREVLSRTARNHPDYPARLSNISIMLSDHYEQTKDSRLFDEAVDKARLATERAPIRHPLLAGFFTNFTTLLQQKYARTKSVEYLDEALRISRKAVELTAAENPDRANRLGNLGILLLAKSNHGGEDQYLTEAFSNLRLAVQGSADRKDQRLRWQSSLGSAFWSRYKRTAKTADLTEAISLTQEATEIESSQDIHTRAENLNLLGVMLMSKFERTENLTDIRHSIKHIKRAIYITPVDHIDRASWFTHLGNAFQLLFQEKGGMENLHKAIRAAKRAVALTTAEGHPHRATCLSNLASKLSLRFEQTGRVQDLEESLGMAQQVLNMTPTDHNDRVGYLCNVGNRLHDIYEQEGDMTVLDKAIADGQEAAAGLQDNHIERGGLLGNLSIKLKDKYQRTGHSSDLDEGILTAKRALKETPSDHVDRKGHLSTLSTMFSLRHERTGDMPDLDKAIEQGRKVLEHASNTDSPYYAKWETNLGAVLVTRYERIGDVSSLEEAIDRFRKALNASSITNQLHLAGMLNNLGVALEMRYQERKDVKDLHEAIASSEKGIALKPDDYPGREMWLSNLGNKLEKEYHRTSNKEDLERAIEYAQNAKTATPPDHPGRAGILYHLGTKLKSQYDDTKLAAHLDSAIQALLDAWSCVSSVPFDRIRAGALGLKLLKLKKDVDQAVTLGISIIEMMPKVNTRKLDRGDQEYVMSRFAGIASDVAALLLEQGRVLEALHYLENGRAVTHGRLIDDRSDADLARLPSKMAAKYNQLIEEVNSSQHLHGQHSPSQERVSRERHREAVVELEDCIQEIRDIPGYERFLMGQTSEEMQECAKDGTIVIVNINDLRSDAIIVTPLAVKAVNLPKLSASVAAEWLQKEWWRWNPLSQPSRREKNKELSSYLDWLWRVCVGEILDAIRLSPVKAGEEPERRIWWIGAGMAGSMPFHAAGMHLSRSTDNVYCRAISSYTPSIKALHHATRRSKAASGLTGSLLVATMGTTPGLARIGNVQKEKNQVVDATKAMLEADAKDQPSAALVIDGLLRCSIAHLACHGYTDEINPSQSSVVFQARGSDGIYVQDELSVRKISSLRLKSARLAYLSACSTAENRVADLADEVVHVVSGFQVAGFPHVVGCLWPAMSGVCVRVAPNFYKLLLESGVSWADEAVPLALHRSVMAIRREDPEWPLDWACFVHFGA